MGYKLHVKRTYNKKILTWFSTAKREDVDMPAEVPGPALHGPNFPTGAIEGLALLDGLRCVEI